LAQLFSYKLVFFANADSLDRIVKRLKPTEMARLLHTNKGLDGSRFVVKRERTFTVCNDLRQPLETLWKSFAPYNRAEIRKAERLVERVRITRNEPAGLDDFIAVYNDFARLKDGVWPISARLLNRYDGFADRLVLYSTNNRWWRIWCCAMPKPGASEDYTMPAGACTLTSRKRLGSWAT
jgi:hypothetical protein